MHSQWHRATHATLSPPIPTAQRYSYHVTGRPPRQSQRHSATHRTPSPPIPMAQRRPHPRSPHQSQRHSAAHATPSPPITLAQRYPYHALPANHNGTARPTGGPHTTRPPPIRTAQRIGPDMPTLNPQQGATATKQSRYRPILRAQRIGNEHGPAPRPPSQKQEPFATRWGNVFSPIITFPPCGISYIYKLAPAS